MQVAVLTNCLTKNVFEVPSACSEPARARMSQVLRWDQEPANRPSFREVSSELTEHATDTGAYAHRVMGRVSTTPLETDL